MFGRSRNRIVDHSQFGEFPLFLKVARPKRQRVIVDVGALGKDGSNSYDLLSQLDWRGVLVEANPNLWDEIERDFSGLNSSLVRSAVSDVEGLVVLHLGVVDGVSSIVPGTAEAWGPSRGSVEVQARRLGAILDEQQVPLNFDLLSLDIEGMDMPVLNDLIANTRYRPRWIFLEASLDFQTKSLAELDLVPAVRDQYEIVGQTVPNLLLAHCDALSASTRTRARFYLWLSRLKRSWKAGPSLK
jgi:FkbM family methyltransferase